MSAAADLVGQTVSHYRIVKQIGAGGMGVVYQARDANLDRDVAVKVLPAAFAADADRLRRFEREARAAGALNHPNVLAVYDFGLCDTAPYLVTELLQGETLRERLSAGALPLRKALDYAIQAANGLGSAHEKGIVHRDLKPENLFICSDGRVKILDFGLAKLVTAEDAEATRTSPQADEGATQSGSVMGTMGYLAPEQLRGQTADARADIFSLGAIVYEMCSGRRAFRGESPADTASAILREDPPALSSTGPQLPPALERIVHRCLEKSPGERYQSARDLAFQLESLSTISQGAMAPALGESVRATWSRTLRNPWFWATAAVLLVFAGMEWQRARTARNASPRNVTLRRLTDFAGISESPAISPDGKSVAFVSDSTGTRQIWVRLLAGGPPLQLTHDAGNHRSPRWAPDSATILYYKDPAEGQSEGSEWEIPALGGVPRRLQDCVGGADISHSGEKLVFFRRSGENEELVLSSRDGSDARVLAPLAPLQALGSPRWSPDDQKIGFELSKSTWDDDLYEVAASGGKPRQITRQERLLGGFAWTPDGKGVVYSTSLGNTVYYLPRMSLWLAPIDAGAPRPLTFGESSDTDPEVDRNGRVLLSRLHRSFDIWKFPVSGTAQENVQRAVRITRQTGQVQTPTLSPGDREMAYLSDSGGHGNIWVMNLATGETRQITFEQDPNVTLGVPVWSPDGQNITFASTRTVGTWFDVGYWLVHPDGGGLRNVIERGSWATWSRDSKEIYFISGTATQSSNEGEVARVSVEGGPPQLVRHEKIVGGEDLGPGDAVLYFVAQLENVNGRLDYEVRAAQPPDGPARTLAQIAGWRVPVWQGLHPIVSHDGKWLALTLEDSLGTDLWVLPTAGGQMRRVTDFGERRTFIVRRVAWSADDKYIYAAVGEGNADILEFEGLLP